eukprot:CCRYP_011398-RA/>CCRYP_011398-RA protein AED:0.47 eAED:0.47 QI:0/0/0/1/1/1/2/0/83
MVNGKQMMITWHFDDLKASHEDELELTKLLLFLAKKYGDKITANRGDLHNYLGMDMDYSREGAVRLSLVRDPEETERENKYLT